MLFGDREAYLEKLKKRVPGHDLLISKDWLTFTKNNTPSPCSKPTDC